MWLPAALVMSVLSELLGGGGQGGLPSAREASSSPVCVCVPTDAAMSSAFTLAGTNRLDSSYPRLPKMGVDASMVPPVILKAVAWVESNWNQFAPGTSLPLLSPDYGYGAMQITSGMAGAFGDSNGTLPIDVQARIGGNFTYNIAYGAKMLADNFLVTPAINNRNPTLIEDWYYAVWAYNGWGWVNNPNNPRFSRYGNPGTDPVSWPYQDRVFYLIEHPPLDAQGRPLWTPMHVTLPTASEIGSNARSLSLTGTHSEIPHQYGASYDIPRGLTAMKAGSTVQVHVKVYNSSALPWTTSSGQSYALMYHWVQSGSASNPRFDHHLGGIDIYDSTAPILLKKSVPVGGSIRLPVQLTAPNGTGSLSLEWDMVSQQDGWFSYNSVATGSQTVQIASPNSSVAPYQDPSPLPTVKGNNAWVVRYITSPPATITPGATFSETVLVFNPGSTAWRSSYRLHGLGANQSLPIKWIPGCRLLPLTIHATAPAKPGVYNPQWRLTTDAGKRFGAPIRGSFTVVG